MAVLTKDVQAVKLCDSVSDALRWRVRSAFMATFTSSPKSCCMSQPITRILAKLHCNACLSRQILLGFSCKHSVLLPSTSCLTILIFSQVKLIEEACTDYLLELSLPLNKLVQLLVLLDRLMLMDARRRLLKKYAHQTWTPEIMEILPPLFKQLLRGGFQEHTLCSEVLFSSQCGALCEVQASSSYSVCA